MTLRRNRATRIEDRRRGALERLQVGLNSGERGDRHGTILHDAESRKRATAEADRLALLLAKPAAVTFTRKSKTFAPHSPARKAHQSGKLA